MKALSLVGIAFAVFLAATVGAAMAAAPAQADPAIWRVVGPRASVYLVGSTPAVPADDRWQTPALRNAATSAQEIWFTTPFGLPGPLTALRMLSTIESKGYLPEGQNLSAMLSPEGRAILARLATEDGIPLQKLDRMTPWYAHVTLGIAARKRDGTVKGLPVERFVLSLASKNAPRRSIDNLEDDLKLLIDTPPKEQVYNLEDAMRRYADPSTSARYGQAWADGDLGWIAREREDKLRREAPATYQILQLTPRKRWADRVAALAEGDKTAILILDAANLVGPNGLPNLLRRRGLTVEGPG